MLTRSSSALATLDPCGLILGSVAGYLVFSFFLSLLDGGFQILRDPEGFLGLQLFKVGFCIYLLMATEWCYTLLYSK